jgi:hypothetical protein
MAQTHGSRPLYISITFTPAYPELVQQEGGFSNAQKE